MNENTGKSNSIMTIVAIIAVVIAVINISVTITKISEFRKITGYGIETGTVNLTIISFREINFSRWEMNWSYGSIGAGSIQANLTAYAESAMALGGNWSNNTAKALILVNTGSANASIVLGAGKTAATLLGGSAALANYSWNITDKEVGSCAGKTAAINGIFNQVNASVKVCTQFGTLPTANEIYISIRLSVPYDGTTGSLGDVITATAAAGG
jgi:hypothetical protein